MRQNVVKAASQNVNTTAGRNHMGKSFLTLVSTRVASLDFYREEFTAWPNADDIGGTS
jgi:hypothetical protein